MKHLFIATILTLLPSLGLAQNISVEIRPQTTVLWVSSNLTHTKTTAIKIEAPIPMPGWAGYGATAYWKPLPGPYFLLGADQIFYDISGERSREQIGRLGLGYVWEFGCSFDNKGRIEPSRSPIDFFVETYAQRVWSSGPPIPRTSLGPFSGTAGIRIRLGEAPVCGSNGQVKRGES